MMVLNLSVVPKAKEKPPHNVTVLEGENMGMGDGGKWGFI